MEELVFHLHIIVVTTRANAQAPGWEISVMMMWMNVFTSLVELKVHAII
jgi:hypothetical protein